MHTFSWFRITYLAILFSLFTTMTASAVIMVLTPLKQPLEQQEFIFIVKVKEILPDKPGMVLTLDENLKGKSPFERLAVNLTGDQEAAKEKHRDVLLDRIDKEVPIILFANRRGTKVSTFAFTNGTWFQLEGRVEKTDGQETVRWSFLHCEPYLRRTFKGTTEELKTVIVDYVKNKKEPPAPDEKEKPGYGPPIKKTSAIDPGHPSGLGSISTTPECRYAVIQIPFIGLIAALAALFPTVFGGLAVFMSRWLSLLSCSGMISIVYFLYFQFPSWIRWTGIHSESRLWIACGVLGLLGGIWSDRRYRRFHAAQRGQEMKPGKADRWVIWLLFAVALGFLIYGFATTNVRELLGDSSWAALLITVFTLLVGSLALLVYYLRIHHRKEGASPRFSIETGMLLALAGSFAFVGAYEIGRGGSQQSGVSQRGGASLGVGNGVVGETRLLEKPKWVFQPEKNGQMFSTPAIGAIGEDGKAARQGVFVSVFHREGFDQYGRVYALDLETGKQVWAFDDDGDMKGVFCSPIFHDGKVYVGEGFHKDSECKIYCLNAADGKKVWEFKTRSHAESTPAIAEGKIVFGAGNDGLYCLEAKTGKELWHYTYENGIHIDANPVIADGKVYAGSGKSMTHQVNRIFCLDLADGKEVWGERVEHSAYGSPNYHEKEVVFGIGNSTFSEQREPITGAVLCRNAETGKEVWSCNLPHTVIGRPAIDRSFVYAGCWDGNLYAIHRRTTPLGKAGTVAWKQSLSGGPVVSGITLEGNPKARIADVLYAGGQMGTLAAIDPMFGEIAWSINFLSITDSPKVDTSGTPTVVVTREEKMLRRLVLAPLSFERGGVALPVTRLYCFEEQTKLAE